MKIIGFDPKTIRIADKVVQGAVDRSRLIHVIDVNAGHTLRRTTLEKLADEALLIAHRFRLQ